jgi:hypothetical protein
MFEIAFILNFVTEIPLINNEQFKFNGLIIPSRPKSPTESGIEPA